MKVRSQSFSILTKLFRQLIATSGSRTAAAGSIPADTLTAAKERSLTAALRKVTRLLLHYACEEVIRVKIFDHHVKLRFICLHMPAAMALMFRKGLRKDACMTSAGLIKRVLTLSLGVASLFISAISGISAPPLCRPAWS